MPERTHCGGLAMPEMTLAAPAAADKAQEASRSPQIPLLAAVGVVTICLSA